MKFPCPRCRTGMELHATPGKKIHVSCGRCGLEDLVEFVKNPDEAFLEFLTRFDGGQTPTDGQVADIMEKEGQGRVRSRDEVKKMIGDGSPDGITREILFTRSDYLSEYRVLEDPDPEMGCHIADMDLDGAIIRHVRDRLGIGSLYRFQEEAIRSILAGNSTVIEAPTASGKTEAFLIPVVQMIRDADRAHDGGGDDNADNDSRTGAARPHNGPGRGGGILAILVYPTKALSRDQYPKIRGFADSIGAGAGIFDGDTAQADRKAVLDDPPEILVTNFDVLHYHLWHRTGLASLLAGARVLVVDEAHTYSGIFGSNVHYIIKRLKRICPDGLQVVAASATLENAGDFCTELAGQQVRRIHGTGRRGRTDFAMLLPVLHTQRDLMIELAAKMAGRGHKTMVFSNSHRNAEILAIQARRQKIHIKVHRAGLAAGYRRNVEAQFREGRLGAISCTPTLELGIDIGSVDCVISSTIPVNRLVQRMGRAARKGQNGYAFLVLGSDPISQYYGNHPGDYFEDAERTYIDPYNPFVEEAQVMAMACDMPISWDELPEHREAIRRHVAAGNLMEVGGDSHDGIGYDDDCSDDDGSKRGGKKNAGGRGTGGSAAAASGRGGGRVLLVPDTYRARSILGGHNIRGIGDRIDIIHNGRKVGDRYLPIALEELHEDAIYLLAGSRYRVEYMGYPESGFARITRASAGDPHHTKALTREWPTVMSVMETRRAYGTQIAFCNLHVRKTVYGYVNVEFGKDEGRGGAVALRRPLEYDLVTKAVMLRAPRPSETVAGHPHDRGPEYTEAGGYHAAEHVMIEGGNMITGGASQDMGGISLYPSGMIYIYDGAAGGSGASKALYDRFEKVVLRSRAILGECPCGSSAGCPRCTFSYRCGNNNDYLHKRAAHEILGKISGGQVTGIAEHAGDDRPLV